MEIVRYQGESAFKAFCDHCGNITYQEKKLSEVCQEEDEPYTYTLAKCTICDGFLLRKHSGDWHAPIRPSERGMKPALDPNDYEQLWPPSLGLAPEAPERVRRIYEEARLVRKQSPSSFVVQIRRALESVAYDKEAQGRNLYQQMDWLIETDQLPALFGEMAQLNRVIGNLGAHDAEFDVEPEDTQIVDEFFKAIIEFLYVAPAKVERVNELIAERKQRQFRLD